MFKVYREVTMRFPTKVSGSIYASGQFGKTIHKSPLFKYPQVSALKLPTNVVNINEAEIGRFSPLRERDISGPVINVHNKKHEMSRIDITLQSDPHVNKYDCRGAVSLSSSMQSNVPSPFSGNNTHLNMPGSQWGQGYKYLSDHLHNAHYLSLRNEYKKKQNHQVVMMTRRKMSTDINTSSLSTKDKFKKAIKEYGSTVVVFHVTISLMSLGGCYLLVSSGVNVEGILTYFNLTESNAIAANAGTFVIAYGVHKVFAPARIAITLTATPFIVRYLRKVGFLRKSNTGGGKLLFRLMQGFDSILKSGDHLKEIDITTRSHTYVHRCAMALQYDNNESSEIINMCNDVSISDGRFLFDFTKGDDVHGWQEQSDTVRSVGMSKAVFVLHHNTEFRRAIFFALLNPQVNGAGFAGSRALGKYDLTGFSKLQILCRGQGQYNGYKIVLRHKGLNDEPNYSFEQYFQAPKDEFAVRNLPFSEFKAYYRGKKVNNNETLDISQITSIGIQIYGGVYQPIKQRGPATLEVDWIKAL